jgi:hypothetical protein
MFAQQRCFQLRSAAACAGVAHYAYAVKRTGSQAQQDNRVSQSPPRNEAPSFKTVVPTPKHRKMQWITLQNKSQNQLALRKRNDNIAANTKQPL